MKYVLLLTCLLASATLYSQMLFKNTVPLLEWKIGDKGTKEAKLKNGNTLKVKFDGIFVDLDITVGTTSFSVDYIEDDGNWDIMQVMEHDFDHDGINELVVAYRSIRINNLKANVYRINGSKVEVLGNFEGEDNCILESNKLIIPLAFGQSFKTFTLVKGKFIPAK
jgi:hypothetical protein